MIKPTKALDHRDPAALQQEQQFLRLDLPHRQSGMAEVLLRRM